MSMYDKNHYKKKRNYYFGIRKSNFQVNPWNKNMSQNFKF